MTIVFSLHLKLCSSILSPENSSQVCCPYDILSLIVCSCSCCCCCCCYVASVVSDSATLPDSLMSSSSSPVASSGFSMYSIMSFSVMFYFFSNLNSFYFFFCSDCCGQNFQNYPECRILKIAGKKELYQILFIFL